MLLNEFDAQFGHIWHPGIFFTAFCSKSCGLQKASKASEGSHCWKARWKGPTNFHGISYTCITDIARNWKPDTGTKPSCFCHKAKVEDQFQFFKSPKHTVFSQPPIVQVLPLKIMTEVCSFHHWYTSTLRVRMWKNIHPHWIFKYFLTINSCVK